MKLVLLENKDIFFELIQGSNLVGRWDNEANTFPEIDLDELDVTAKVSRHHAVIWVDEEGKAILEDTGSLNGTWLNKTQIHQGEKAHLKKGDELIFGALKFVIQE